MINLPARIHSIVELFYFCAEGTVQFLPLDVLQMSRITEQIASELNRNNREALRLMAKTLGRTAWILEMERLRDECAALISVSPTAWKKHHAWKTEATRCLHLCCMLMCAQQGLALLDLLSSRISFLADGNDHRMALAYASEFVRDLQDRLPDSYWPLPGCPFDD